MKKGTIVRVAGRPGIFLFGKVLDARGNVSVTRLDFDRPRSYWAAMYCLAVPASMVTLACARCCTRKDEGLSVPRRSCRGCDEVRDHQVQGKERR